jgi:hypothetical protein
MKTTAVTDSRLYGLVVLYDMHTDFFKRAIDGIPRDAAQSRLDTKANHVAWLTGSLVEERYELARFFGLEGQQNADALFRNHKGIQDNMDYPELSEFGKDWERISPLLRDILLKMTPEKSDTVFDMDGMKMSNYEYISFMMYREANCIGQIALWRRLLGYPALKYD